MISNAQYLGQAALQRISTDQSAIANDNADIQAKQTEINSIYNDPDYNAVINEVSAVATNQTNTVIP